MALRDGADEVVIFWPVFRDMLQHSLTDTWNETFANEWKAIYDAGLMEGCPLSGSERVSLAQAKLRCEGFAVRIS